MEFQKYNVKEKKKEQKEKKRTKKNKQGRKNYQENTGTKLITNTKKQKQKYRPMEQDRKPRNKPTYWGPAPVGSRDILRRTA